jgi:hypothetical protein
MAPAMGARFTLAGAFGCPDASGHQSPAAPHSPRFNVKLVFSDGK